MSQAQYAGTGRRKNAVARVRLVPGTGKITVNKKDVEEYIPHADLRLVINQLFAVTSIVDQSWPRALRQMISRAPARVPISQPTRYRGVSPGPAVGAGVKVRA